jgi:hypothetical protein
MVGMIKPLLITSLATCLMIGNVYAESADKPARPFYMGLTGGYGRTTWKRLTCVIPMRASPLIQTVFSLSSTMACLLSSQKQKA